MALKQDILLAVATFDSKKLLIYNIDIKYQPFESDIDSIRL